MDGTSTAGESKDKKVYNLFHPTPPDLMRELSTDRPDKTESPYTVDAGHFQWEMDFAVFTLEREDGVRSRTWNIAPANLKVGLTNNADLQLFFDSYIHERVEDQRRGWPRRRRRGQPHDAAEAQPLGRRWRHDRVRRNALRHGPDEFA